MTARSASNTQLSPQLDRSEWVRLGLATAAVGIAAVLIVQGLAIAIWPDIALFDPLNNYVRSAIFTLVPALGATVLFAWLVADKTQPAQTFIRISVAILIVSIIPDYPSVNDN